MSTAQKKRWLVVLPEQQQEWIRATADEVEMRGSDIISELIANGMKDTKFKASLARARTVKALQELNDKRTAIEEQMKELQKATKE